jgi:hypothetical protein
MPAEAFLYKGAYTYALIEHLEACGYSVELWVYIMTSDNMYTPQNILKMYVKVKEFAELLDTNKIACSVAGVFAFRRFFFSLMEQLTPAQCQTFGVPNDGYSYPYIHKWQDATLPEDMELNPLVITTTNMPDKDAILNDFKLQLKNNLDARFNKDNEKGGE